jgi:hypothetical protein
MTNDEAQAMLEMGFDLGAAAQQAGALRDGEPNPFRRASTVIVEPASPPLTRPDFLKQLERVEADAKANARAHVACCECGGNGTGPDRCDGPGDAVSRPCPGLIEVKAERDALDLSYASRGRQITELLAVKGDYDFLRAELRVAYERVTASLPESEREGFPQGPVEALAWMAERLRELDRIRALEAERVEALARRECGCPVDCPCDCPNVVLPTRKD